MIKFTDLHTHLGGSTSPDVLRSIAYDRGVKINKMNYEDFDNLICYNPVDKSVDNVDDKKFKNYLDRYKLIQKIASSPIAISESVYQAFRNAYINGNVDLMELKINPMLRNMEGIYDLDSIISAACDGLQKAKSIFNMKCGLIIESDRSYKPELSIILANKASKFKDRGVVGFDISGYNKNFSVLDHMKALHIIKNAELGVTVHTNEIKTELEIYNEEILKSIDRIGHGIKIFQFGSQVEAILEINPDVVFEICPNSNITSGASTRDILLYIKEQIRRYNVNYTICSDGFVFNGHVGNNMETLKMTDKEIEEMSTKSRNYSFIKE